MMLPTSLVGHESTVFIQGSSHVNSSLVGYLVQIARTDASERIRELSKHCSAVIPGRPQSNPLVMIPFGSLRLCRVGWAGSNGEAVVGLAGPGRVGLA